MRFPFKNKHKNEMNSAITAGKQTNLVIEEIDEKLSELEVYRQTLTFPGKLVSEKEAEKLMEMRVTPKQTNGIIIKRLIFSLAVAAVLIMLAISFNAPKVIALPGGLVGFTAMWFMSSSGTNSVYEVFRFNRQLNFTQFTRLLIPYLTKLSDGVSLYQVFKEMLHRLDNDIDRKCLERLMVDMTNNPNSPAPFSKFAYDFSGTDRAELFMLSVYDMKQGSFDPSVVTDLGRQASDDLMKQIDKVIKMKTKRFNNLSTWLTMCSAIVMIGYLGTLVFSVMSDGFGSF